MKRSRSNSHKASYARSSIALLTDFGISDHYVGTVKGVIHSIHSQATIIDITHEVQPQQVRQAGYLLWAAYKYFPKGTVFLSIVDPGVGTNRRILAVRTKNYVFIAPDNMLLDAVLSEEQIVEAVEINMTSKNPYIFSPVSNTFHGRDIFAPVTAYLAAGISFNEIGKSIALHPAMSPFVESESKPVKGEVLHIDRFGNVITNLRGRKTAPFSLKIAGKTIHTWINNYAEAPEQTVCLIHGSSGLVEIVVKNGNAKQKLKAEIASEISFSWK